ncbi:rod-determining factor RdfA [Halocatena marina]|uniref:Rod-determining factor RdfA n=1 Tax=Halocatena marina TaxID=2934937 RepID=A0ABD5YUA4_9EURY|nr:rod-determining factor RdfA [Halocatena marina]
MASTSNDKPLSKVARLLKQYQLEDFGETLESMWLGEDTERMSLRDLADIFNKKLLEQKLHDAGLGTTQADVDTMYKNQTADTVSAGVRTKTRTRLQHNGIDVDRIEDDFVTYQAIRSYLKDYRGVEYEAMSDSEKVQKDIDAVQRLTNRTQLVTEDRIEKLQNTGRVTTTEFTVFVESKVFCSECGTQYSVHKYLEQGGCSCETEG